MKNLLVLLALAATVSMVGCSASADPDELAAPPASANAKPEETVNKGSAGAEAPVASGPATAAEKPAGM